jgi:hypothetical protein
MQVISSLRNWGKQTFYEKVGKFRFEQTGELLLSFLPTKKKVTKEKIATQTPWRLSGLEITEACGKASCLSSAGARLPCLASGL